MKDGKSGVWRILLMFSMIRPLRTPWRPSRRRLKSICASHANAGATFPPYWLGGWGVATEPEPSASTNEFGLGGALTLDGVQQRWTTVKANFGPLLSNLHPLAAPERRQGKTGYRLVVGPLPNSPAATGLCAHFNAAHTPCRAVRFEGEQIAQG